MAKIVRTISDDASVVATAIDATDIVSEIEQIHKTSAVVTAALGRLTIAASLMGIGLNKYGKLDVAGAVGKEGTLSVVKDLGLKEPYCGQIPIASGEIAEDIASYFATSEQIPTVCGLGVLVNPDLTVKAAGGYLIQLLPFADEGVIDTLEKNVNALPSVTQMLSSGVTAEDMAMKVLEGLQPNVMDRLEASYKCDCSRERVETALISIGKKELSDMADEQETSEVCCHFCGKKYTFTSDEIRSLAEKAKA